MNSRKRIPFPLPVRMGLATLLAFAALTALLVSAASGDLDPTFDADGLATANLDNEDIVTALALQADGKIVAAGYVNDGADDDFVLARFHADGSLDTAFGAGGFVVTDFGGKDDRAYAVAIQPDGRIVVAGTADMGGELFTNFDFALARFDGNGAPDPTFGGGDGKTTTNSNLGLGDYGRGIALQTDGKIVVAGYTYTAANMMMALARYNSDGSPDPAFGFGIGGIATSHEFCEGRAVALQPNGWIIVAGICAGGGDWDFGLAQYDASGFPAPTFGVNGLALTDFGADEVASAIAIQRDGWIVAAGDSGIWGGCDSPQDLALARYNSLDGSLDPGFGTGGLVTTDFGLGQPGLCLGEEKGYALALQPDGRIIVGGSTGSGSGNIGAANDFALARYNPDGSLDVTFGANGFVVSPLAGVAASAGQALARQPDGRILIAGWLAGGNPITDFFIARIHTRESASASVGGALTPIGDTNVSARFESGGACTVTVAKHIAFPGDDNGNPGEMPTYWELANNCGGDYSMTLEFCYTESELQNAVNVTEGNLAAFKQATSSAWLPQGGALDTITNCVTLTGVTSLSRWTLGDPTTFPPAVASITRADANPTNAASVDFTVVFSKPVTGVDLADFTLTTTGVSGATLDGLGGTGDTYTLTVSTGTGDGALRLDLPATAVITDGTGSPLSDLPFTYGEAYTVNRSTPILLAPADGALLPTNRPTFDWQDYPAAIGYHIQISKNVGFTLLVSNTNLTGGTNSTYTPAANLAAKTNMWWRVRARLTATTYSGWSEVRAFTTANPPPAPLLVAPVANALVTSPTVKLDWNNIIMPGGTVFQKYEVQMATDTAFTVNVTLADAPISEYTTPALTPNTKYYWRVRAYNSLGQYGNWSAARYFRAALSAPNSLTPGTTVLPEEQLLTRRPTFTWDAVTGATGYTIQVSKNSTFTLLAATYTIRTATSQYTHTLDLAANTSYFWRVKANGANGPSLYSQVRMFRTANPPSVPTLASPLNNALVTTTTPLLNWNNSTVPAGTTFRWYEVQMDTSNTFGGAVSANTTEFDLNNSQYTPAPLLNGVTYYWRVRSINTAGEFSGWSLVRRFRTAYAAPILTLPLNGATGVALKPTFTWDPIAGVTSYTLQVSKNNTFTLLVANKTIYAPTTTYIHTLNLLPNTTYYWRVRGNGTYGPGLWQSPAFSFTTTP